MTWDTASYFLMCSVALNVEDEMFPLCLKKPKRFDKILYVEIVKWQEKKIYHMYISWTVNLPETLKGRIYKSVTKIRYHIFLVDYFIDISHIDE